MRTVKPCPDCGIPHRSRHTPRDPRPWGVKTCAVPNCTDDKRGEQAYCFKHHAQYMRGHRPTYSELSPLARLKNKARAYLNVYVTKGYVKRQPCRVCGALKAQAHHHDYTKPLDVDWLCRIHHLEEHKAQAAA